MWRNLTLLGVILFLLGVIARPDVPWAVFVGVVVSLLAGAAHATIRRGQN